MIIENVSVGPLDVNCYIVGCESTRQAAIIDPGEDEEKILERLKALNLNATHIVLTHGHVDHIGAVPEIQQATNALILMGQNDRLLVENAVLQAEMFSLRVPGLFNVDQYLADNDEIVVGSFSFKVITTPGHSPGGICLLYERHLWAGDTLFFNSVGRTDLPGGSMEELYSSIKNKLYLLHPETIVYPGHGDYTTIGHEMKHNPYIS